MTPAVHIRVRSCREKLSLLPVSVIFHSADGTVQTSWADTGSVSAAVEVNC